MFSVVGTGGAEYQILRLAGALLHRGYEVHLISLDSLGATTFYALPEGVSWHRLGWMRTLFGKLKRIKALKCLIRQLDLRAFVGFVMGADKTIYASLTGTGVPLIAAERNDPVIYKWTFNPIGRALHWLLFLLCKRIVIQLKCYRKKYPWFLRQRIETIHNPLRVADPMPQRQCTDDTLGLTILNVGRLHWQKGQDLLLDAFAQSGIANLGCKLRIVGSGLDRSDLTNRCSELGILSHVNFCEPKASIEDEYAAADLFAFPSRYEGFPNALAEAMARGLPCIALRDCLGAAALIEHDYSGILIAGETREERVCGLANALVLLRTDNELRRQLGERAIKATQPYSGDDDLDCWDSLLQRVSQ